MSLDQINKIESQRYPDRLVFPPQIIMLCGFPGSGKSTLARIIVHKTNFIVLRTDAIRAQISNRNFSNQENDLVYETIFRSAENAIKDEIPVILDGTFTSQKRRNRLEQLCSKLGVKLTQIEVRCPEEKLLDQIRSRVGDLSEADESVYFKMKALNPEFNPDVVVENSGDLSQLGLQTNKILMNLFLNKSKRSLES